MMRSTCVVHPADEPLILMRAWQVKACDGNHCAAALLNFFEHGHNSKLKNQKQAIHANKIAEGHGDIGGQDVTLLQWYNQEELEEGLLGLYERKTISKAIHLLVAKGFISLHGNPNPRYHFDHTRYFLFNPEKCRQVIETLDHPKMDHRPSINGSTSSILGSSSSKNGSTIPEISPETSCREEEEPLPTVEVLAGTMNGVHVPAPEPTTTTGATPKGKKQPEATPLDPTDWLYTLLQEYADRFPFEYFNDSDWWTDKANGMPVFSKAFMELAFADLSLWLRNNPRRKPRDQQNWRRRMTISLNYYYDHRWGKGPQNATHAPRPSQRY